MLANENNGGFFIFKEKIKIKIQILPSLTHILRRGVKGSMKLHLEGSMKSKFEIEFEIFSFLKDFDIFILFSGDGDTIEFISTSIEKGLCS